MKLKYNFETVDMGDEIICVPVGVGAEEVHGVLKLNKSGEKILDLLKEETNIDRIAKKITGAYDNDPNEIYDYVRNTVDTLRKIGLIEG